MSKTDWGSSSSVTDWRKTTVHKYKIASKFINIIKPKYTALIREATLIDRAALNARYAKQLNKK